MEAQEKHLIIVLARDVARSMNTIATALELDNMSLAQEAIERRKRISSHSSDLEKRTQRLGEQEGNASILGIAIL